MVKMIQPEVINLNELDWLHILNKPPALRGGYNNTEEQLKFQQVAGRLLGTHIDEDEYFEFLYDLLDNSEIPVLLLNKELNKFIPNERFQSLQRILLINNEEKGLSVNRLIAFLEGECLIPKTQVPFLDTHLRNKLKDVLNHFRQTHKDGFLHVDFRRILVDIVKWMFNHLEEWAKTIPDNMPRLIWYGNASKSEMYFLYYLILIGFDVLLFHPSGEDILLQIDGKGVLTPIYRYPSTISLIPLPEVRPVRKGTVAYRASKEMERILHTEDSLLYKPWQFRSYVPKAVTLKTTYDEIFLLWKEKAFIRPGFQASGNVIQIPNLFAKVAGVSENKRQYWNKVQEISSHELSLTIRSFPIANPVSGNNHYHYQNALGADGTLDPEKIINGNWWRYKDLPSGLQKGLAAAISRYCAIPKLKIMLHEDLYRLQLYLFNQSMNIPTTFLELLQKFDYSQDVPKVILLTTPQSGSLNRTDAALLLLLNEFGLDIVIFNPSGRNDIENYIEEKHLDTHWLEKISLEDEFKEPSVFKRFINKLF
ncbi:YceG family protein [Bacillus sp. OTU530]|uniref:YceG family protein n=1 Tax=Bacillus sp. OTU530 TaxID=3043862 RepID=UPI00313EE6D6